MPFNPNITLIDNFVRHIDQAFDELFPSNQNTIYPTIIQKYIKTALQYISTTDCLYHDIHHTIQAIEVSTLVLKGKMSLDSSITPTIFTHFVLSAAYHDIGYIKGLLPEDTHNSFIAIDSGEKVSIPIAPNNTDAFLSDHHVSRSLLMVDHIFHNHPVICSNTIKANIQMTQFPIEPLNHTDISEFDFPYLLRASDLISQIGDPLYLKKLSKLYLELQEIDKLKQFNLSSVCDMKNSLPTFYKLNVKPYIQSACYYLKQTSDGRLWLHNLSKNIATFQTQQQNAS